MASEHSHPMMAQDWFGVGIRLCAFWPLLLSFQNLLDFIVAQAGWSYGPLASSETSHESYLLYAFGHGAVGLMLLWNARKITRFTYSRPDDGDVAE